MLKTIKRKKKLRVDEIFKYILDNNIDYGYFPVSNNETKGVTVYEYVIMPEGNFYEHDTFTVEVEEPIKDVTLLKEVVYVHENESLIKDYDTSIDEILSRHHKGSVSEIHALINGRLELVYEREGEE